MRHTTVAEVMSKRVVSVGPEDSFTDVARLLYTATISAVPVIGPDGDLLGVVSDADLLATAARAGGPEPLTAGPANALGRGPRANVGARTAEELMTAPVETVTPQTGVAEAARKMLELGLRWMPVTDEVARIVGVVSRSDMLAVFLHDDASIRAEVVVDVLERTLLMDPARVEVEVRRGVVTLTGQLDTRADAELAARLTERVEGVICVIDRLRYRVDERPADSPRCRLLILCAATCGDGAVTASRGGA